MGVMSCESSVSMNTTRPFCFCGYVAKEFLARTEKNYGKIFWGCCFYGADEGYCNFFKWKDDAMPEGLLEDKRRLERENSALKNRVTALEREILKKKSLYEVVIPMMFIVAVCSIVANVVVLKSCL